MKVYEGILYLLVATIIAWTLPLPELKNTDLFAYYSASQIVRQGLNPYEEEPLGTLQRSYAPEWQETFRIWNPPVVFGVLMPLSYLSPSNALKLWLAASLLCMCAIGHFCWELCSKRPAPPIVAIGATLLFVPTLLTLRLGQLNLVLVLIFILAIRSFNRDRYFLMGVLYAALLIKPQAVWLPALYLALLIPLQQWFRFALGGASGLLLLSGPAIVLRSSLWIDWLNTPRPPVYNIAASLVGMVRLLLHDGATVPPIWPAVFIPILGLIVLLFVYKVRSRYALSTKLALLSLISAIAMPYGFVNDHMIVILAQIYIAYLSTQPVLSLSQRISLWGLLIFLEVAALCFAGYIGPDHQLFWFPIGLLFIFIIAERFLSRAYLRQTNTI